MYRLDSVGVYDDDCFPTLEDDGISFGSKDEINRDLGGTPLLVEFLHDPKTGRRRGVVVASGAGRVGFALCNERKGDKFDLEYGLYKAAMRSKRRNQSEHDGKVLPFEFRASYVKMWDRANRYFK